MEPSSHARHRSAGGDRLVPPEPRAIARDLRSHRSVRLLLAADRAPQPDRLLRRASAGLQHHRVDQARARTAAGRSAAREAVRARHRSRQRGRRRAAQRRADAVAVARRSARVRRSRRRGHRRRARRRRRFGRRGPSRHAPGRGALHGARARSDAPGDAALHVAPAAVRPEAEACGRAVRDSRDRRSRACGVRRQPDEPARPCASRPASATLGADRDRVTFGWDNEFDAHRVDVAGVRHRRAQRHQRGLPRVRRGRRLPRQRAVVSRGLGVGAAGEAGAPGVLDPFDSRCQ